MNVAAYLQEHSLAVNHALDRFATTGHGRQPQLLQAMRYSLMGGGKRLRPILVIAAAEVFGLSPDRVMPTACALEMIHTYSLIHDDLPCMDDDDFRRGSPANHKVYGEAMATLAGDALLTLAFEVLTLQSEMPGVTPEQAVRVIRAVAQGAGAAGMLGGQVEDLAWEGKLAGAQQLKQIHRLKTGGLFTAALRCGGILGGADQAEISLLDEYAVHFGLAFQIQDDILDVAGDAAKTGKGVGRDQRHDKSTYISAYGLEEARRQARMEVSAAQAALSPLGLRARTLTALAAFVVDREG